MSDKAWALEGPDGVWLSSICAHKKGVARFYTATDGYFYQHLLAGEIVNGYRIVEVRVVKVKEEG